MRILAFITVLFFTFSSVASVNVKAGDVITEDGVFLTKEEAAKLIADKQVATERCEEKIDNVKKVTKIEEQLKIKNLETDLSAEKEKNAAIIALKDKEIDRLYEQIESEAGIGEEWFFIGGTVLGVGVTSLVSIAIFFAAVQTSKGDSLIQQ